MTTTSIAAGFDGWCLKCGPGTDDDLRPVPDMLRFVGKRDGSRLCDAAIIVRDELRRIVGLDLELFMLQPGQRFAEKIADDFTAREGSPAQLAGVVPVVAQARGFVADWRGERSHKVTFKHQEARDAVAVMCGPQGALEVAFETWCSDRVRNPETALMPSKFPWARLAIRASLADQLFTAIEATPALPEAVPAHSVRWGHNVTSEGRPVVLRRVADAIAAACVPGAVAALGLPLRDAARWAIDGLADAQGLRWFMLNRAGWPKLVTDADVWRDELPAGSDILRAAGLVLIGDQWKPDPDRVPVSFADWPNKGPFTLTRAELIERDALHLVEDDGRAESFVFDAAGMARVPGRPACRGVAGLVELLRRQWCERIEGPEGLDAGELAAVAVPAAALAALPWMTNGADIGGSVAGVCEAAAVQPIGGAWPHAKGAQWSDAERDALFEMRHRCGMTDKEIAAAIELDSAQRISQVIGAKDAHRIKDGSAYPEGLRWRPSRDLLARCDIEAGAKLVRVSKTG